MEVTSKDGTCEQDCLAFSKNKTGCKLVDIIEGRRSSLLSAKVRAVVLKDVVEI